MINKISFMGQARFLDGATKTIKPAHKERIENYAKALGKDGDVVIVGTQTEKIYVYNGKMYGENAVSTSCDEDGFKCKIKTRDGEKIADPSEVKMLTKRLPVYNGYIFYSPNKENLNFMPDRIEFDFRGGEDNVKATTISPDGRRETNPNILF